MDLIKRFKDIDRRSPGVTVATHDGKFHLDDVMSSALLKLASELAGVKLSIVRTRDPRIIAKAHVVIDVGEEYRPQDLIFDHHQIRDESDEPECAFSLLFRETGLSILGSYFERIGKHEDVAFHVYKRMLGTIVRSIARIDNNVRIHHGDLPNLSYMIGGLNTVREPSQLNMTDKEVRAANFDKAVLIAYHTLLVCMQNLLVQHEDLAYIQAEINSQKKGPTPEVLILKRPTDAWKGIVKSCAWIRVVACQSKSKQWLLHHKLDGSDIKVKMPQEWLDNPNHLNTILDTKGVLPISSFQIQCTNDNKERVIKLLLEQS